MEDFKGVLIFAAFSAVLATEFLRSLHKYIFA